MNAIAQGLNANAGIFSMLIVCLSAWYAVKAMSKSKANEDVNNAQQRLMSTMKDEIDGLRRKVDDTAKDNTRLRQTIDTMCSALKKQGLIITIDGDLIIIGNSKGDNTIARIQEQIV